MTVGNVVWVACENIGFSLLFAAGDVSRETFPSAKSEEKGRDVVAGYVRVKPLTNTACGS